MATKKKTSEATDIAVEEDMALATAAGGDLLADAFGDAEFDFDGLEEVSTEDIKISARIFNFKGKDARTGRAIPPDTFFDTVDETTKDVVNATLLSLHKTNAWTEYSESEGRTKTLCRSFDRINGTMDDGTQRLCEGCPDAQWRQIDGKRKRNCGPVYNVVGIDEEEDKAFLIRFRRTSLEPFKQYLNRYFLGKRRLKNGRGHYPLFAFRTIITLTMSDDGKYALPVLRCEEDENGTPIPNSREKILDAQEQAKFYSEVMLPVLEKHAGSEDSDADANDVNTVATTASDFSDDEDAPAAAGSSAPGLW